MLLDDGHGDRQLQGLVVMHRNIAKADPALEPVGQRRFAGALEVQDGRVLARDIKGEGGRIAVIFFARPFCAALDDGSLVD